MQYWWQTSPIEIIIGEATVAFLIVVTLLLLRYSKNTDLRLWTLGWIIYTVSSLLGAMLESEVLVPTDLIMFVGALVGASLILDGTHEREWDSSNTYRYLVMGLIAAIYGIGSLYFQLTFAQAYTPVQIYVGYVSLKSASKPVKLDIDAEVAAYGAAGGFLLLAFSSFLFPLVNLYPILGAFALLQATALITLGTGLLSLLIRITTRRLEALHAIGQLTSGVLQHDIRNYLHVAANAVELGNQDSEDGEMWRRIAAESLRDATAFVEEMRKVSIELTSFKASLTEIDIEDVVQRVRNSVIREYGLKQEQIAVLVPPKTIAMTNSIVRELLWNILDNGFKHGGSLMRIELVESDGALVLVLSDNAGGMPEQSKRFIMAENPLEKPVSAEAGMGLVLIRGLSPLCGIKIAVEDLSESGAVSGTKYSLSLIKTRK